MNFRTTAVLACAVVGTQACDSSITNAPVHQPPTNPPKIVSVAAGAHTCAISDVGAAYCWGYNGSGQLGNGETSIVNPTPVATAGSLLFRVLSVSKVEDVTCGLTTTDAAFCWGGNDGGQLGDGTREQRLTPTAVAGGMAFKSIAVGSAHVCAISESGAAYCWGTSFTGALGDGIHGTHLTPVRAVPGLTFQSVVAGGDFSCGLTSNGDAYCWGLGISGQLGTADVSVAMTDTAVRVASQVPFTSLVAGGQTACGLAMDGRAFCWGASFFGQVGDGTAATEGGPTRHSTPTAVAGGLTFQSLSAGFNTMCGVTTGGAGYCWGSNFGAIGDGTDDQRSKPTAVTGGLAFRSVSAGTGFTCGVTMSNAVYCWGDNSNGQLGDGTVVARTTPGAVLWPSM